MIKKSEVKYEYIISIENLLICWKILESNKKYRKDVSIFKIRLMDNILNLFKSLKDRTYIHDKYEYFKINDPKPRDIHKATIRDRIVHRLIYQILYSYFDSKFISDSYSCRKNKGTHKALNKFVIFSRKASENHTKQCWVLKCDIRKFFASVDHLILIEILRKYICDDEIIKLIEKVVESFCSTSIGKGLPLGNLTSQLFANVYMNEFDQFVKHVLRQKYYIRYADDFVIMNQNRDELVNILPKIGDFLQKKLKLSLHSNKVVIKTISSGVDFLGWVHFPKHRVLRTTTKQRMFRRIIDSRKRPEVIQSYLGLLKNGNTNLLKKKILSL